jgi:hypothetical protein
MCGGRDVEMKMGLLMLMQMTPHLRLGIVYVFISYIFSLYYLYGRSTYDVVSASARPQRPAASPAFCLPLPLSLLFVVNFFWCWCVGVSLV